MSERPSISRLPWDAHPARPSERTEGAGGPAMFAEMRFSSEAVSPTDVVSVASPTLGILVLNTLNKSVSLRCALVFLAVNPITNTIID